MFLTHTVFLCETFCGGVCRDSVGSFAVPVKSFNAYNRNPFHNSSVALLQERFFLEELLYSAVSYSKPWRLSRFGRQRQCALHLIGRTHLLLCCHCSLLFWLWNSRAWRATRSNKTTPNSAFHPLQQSSNHERNKGFCFKWRENWIKRLHPCCLEQVFASPFTVDKA